MVSVVDGVMRGLRGPAWGLRGACVGLSRLRGACV